MLLVRLGRRVLAASRAQVVSSAVWGLWMSAVSALLVPMPRCGPSALWTLRVGS
jgi:hypothetical protein